MNEEHDDNDDILEPIAEDAPFEDVMDRLEEIVALLDDGELPLEESFRTYEAGVALVRAAKSRLDALDRRLVELTQDGDVRPLQLETSS